ncbi:MAG: AAA family ATPase, partial [Actinomycetota bacterium]|nr:AAA family ATPase [Actinomycetota bacterium]
MGHAREFRALHAERQRSAQGELRVALVLGDAGLGKTRLAAELLPCENEPAVGLVPHGSPFQAVPLFDHWAEALGRHVGGLDADEIRRACGSGLGDLPTLLRSAETAPEAPSWAEVLRCHFVEQIPRLLTKASADHPVVVILDDAHECDDAVWEMLSRLAWDFPADRLFVLVTARPGELARHRCAVRTLQTLEQAGVVRRVHLSPLTEEDVRELAAALLRQDQVPAALVDWLMVRSRGNPRLAVGLLEALVDEDADLQAPVLCGVPEKLARWVRAEVARLNPSTLPVLEVLAVVGDLVDPDDLAQIVGQPVEDVAPILERLVGSGMVIEQEHGLSLGYEVAHPLIREVLYVDIGGARRRVMHRRVAQTLLGSGRVEVTIDTLLEEARQATLRRSHSQVWAVVQTLLDLLPFGDERWLDVFDALSRWSDWGIPCRTEWYGVAEMAAVQRMRQLLAGVSDLRRQAHVRLWVAGLLVYVAGDLDAGECECRQARALYWRAGCEHESLMAAIELAKIRGWAGDLRGQELAARQLVSEAERARDQRGLAGA